VADHDLLFAGARGQLAALNAGTTTSRQLVELVLAHIASHDPALRAFRVVLPERARADADAADRARAAGESGLLLGLPVAVKDDTDVAGVPTLLGSGSAEPAAVRDAPIVQRLRAAGAVVVGKTNLPELALWGVTASQWHGVTRNPWDTQRTPGGSSGGSAAAVASGMVALATGSDGLGSLRIPAAACGLVTLKPTRGLIPQDHPAWNGMSEVGLLAQDVADLVLGMQVVSGLEQQPAPQGIRVGWTLAGPLPGRLDPALKNAVGALVSAAGAQGHQTRAVRIPYGVSSGPAAIVRTWLAGAAADRARLAQPERVERRTARLTRVGGRAGGLLPWAHRTGERLAGRVDRLLEEVDVVVLPATGSLPPPAEALERKGLVRTALVNMAWGPYTGTFNATGHPAVVLPAGRTAAGVPVGVQIVGRPGADAMLLALAGSLETELGLARSRPVLG
jgi:amidase